MCPTENNNYITFHIPYFWLVAVVLESKEFPISLSPGTLHALYVYTRYLFYEICYFDTLSI